MLKEERQRFILDEIRKTSKVRSSDLSVMLSVSEDTIRRDLRELSDQGKIRKVHGGALSNDSNYIPLSYGDREGFAQQQKETIASKVLGLLKDDMVVIVDGGTTNLEIVRSLPSDIKLTIVTNCLPVAMAASEHRFADLFFLGGKVLSGAPVTVGNDVLNTLDEINADIFLVGTRSISVNRGITDIDRDEVLVKRKMMEVSENVVSPCISEKLGANQPFLVNPIGSVDTLVTELDPRDNALTAFVEQGLKVL